MDEAKLQNPEQIKQKKTINKLTNYINIR